MAINFVEEKVTGQTIRNLRDRLVAVKVDYEIMAWVSHEDEAGL